MFRIGKPSFQVFAAALLATAVVGSALADMVYDDEASNSNNGGSQQMSPAPTKVKVTEKSVITTTEAATTAPVVSEAPKLQKASEKSKEKRVFQEDTNNELVVQKLEERRLKQEEKLTNEINKRFTIEQDEAPAGTAAPVMTEEKVVKPINEATSDSYSMSNAPKNSAVVVAPIGQDQITVNQSSVAPVSGSSVKTEGESSEKKKSAGVSIIPRAGFATLTNSSYDINPKFMTGIGIGFDVSDNVGIELGYSYSELGLRMNSPYGVYQPVNELNFKNNTIDAVMKLYLTGTDAKVRPYIGGGGAYSMGYVNYDQSLQQAFMAYGQWYRGTDYSLNQFQAVAQGGVDFKIAPNISLGAAYKFLKPLSSSESEQGLLGGYFYAQPIDPAKQAFRGTIRDSNVSVFQVSASVTF